MVKISKQELRELLEAYYRLCALECGGVDNWSWYSESISDYLHDFWREYECIDDIVDKEIEKYEEIGHF